ncbi:MAG: TonB-dependent receptor [Chitinophagaceae bacterium]|nr:TonB-dependent receptor [Chitinophagaceae bacterium]
MKKILLAACAVFSILHVQAQTEEQKDSIKQVSLTEVVIAGNKFAEKKKNIVQKIDIITAKEIRMTNAQTAADALINTGQVFVQKSQQGGGSPVLRGFEASRIQLNVDGIRFNNAISRSGHMQNIISVDNNSLDRIEVLNGPASTIHGSDALGGVILLKTKDPKMGKTKKFEVTSGNALLRFSTANSEKTGSLGIGFGNKHFASLTQLTYSDFGDLVQGKNGVDSIMNLWKKKFIVERIDGQDSMVVNPDPYKQVATGYSQFDLLQKFTIAHTNHYKHGFNFQLSNSSNIPRYDRLTETSNGIPRNAEWYYGPQFRTLAAYTFNATNLNGFFNDINATMSHQFWKESRHNRSFKKTALNHRTEKVNVTGLNFALRHKDDMNELTLGADAQLNDVKSTAYKEDIITQVQAPIDTRYPDGKNRMNLYGVFVQHTLKLDDGKVVINDGVRFNYTTLYSTLIDTSIQFRLPYDELSQQNKALTGNLGIAYMPQDELRLTANISSGYRSPNIDDMAKVFESVSGHRLMVPNVDLKPEITKNADIGIQYNDGVVDINAYGFYTHFTNAIVSDRFTYNGQDSVLYEGNLTPVFASQNKATAFIYGGGFNVIFRPQVHLSLSGSINYTYGRFNNDTVLVPLDHIPPVTGRLGIKYETKKWYTELYSLYNTRKRLYDYNPNGEDNLQYSTPNGTPGWYTVNFRAGVTVAKYVQLQAGVENILDRNYRYFASGMSAAGRNFIVAMRFNY